MFLGRLPQKVASIIQHGAIIPFFQKERGRSTYYIPNYDCPYWEAATIGYQTNKKIVVKTELIGVSVASISAPVPPISAPVGMLKADAADPKFFKSQ